MTKDATTLKAIIESIANNREKCDGSNCCTCKYKDLLFSSGTVEIVTEGAMHLLIEQLPSLLNLKLTLADILILGFSLGVQFSEVKQLEAIIGTSK